MFIDIGMHYQRISLGDIRRHRVEESDLVFHSILRPPYKKGDAVVLQRFMVL